MDEAKTYQRIGEFVVCFQSIESRIREIGWFILDPDRKDWPPKLLRRDTNAALFSKVEKLFLKALPKCGLDPELEEDFRASFVQSGVRFHNLRRARNGILHSAFIELKAGGEVQVLLRSNPQINVDPETGETLFDQDFLSEKSFQNEFREMAELIMFFNRCYTQLIHRFPQPGYD
jgi:hypothetical protein